MHASIIFNSLKRLVPKKLKWAIKYNPFFRKLKIQKKRGSSKRIFLLGTPVHGNLGDHAIALAELKFFKSYCPDYTVFEVPSPVVAFCMRRLKKLIGRDLICINGGGSMGTIWPDDEQLFQRIIQSFPDNRIIFFPQTVYYEDTPFGLAEMERAKKIYSSHRSLHLFAREEASFKLMQQVFKDNPSYLVPDIATYLTGYDDSHKRDGILLCLRKDKEGIMGGERKKALMELAGRYSNKVQQTDTVLYQAVRAGERINALNEKFDEFKSAQLLITDRLHGMIFAAITATPCIAMNNSSGKVKGVFEAWLKNLEYITFVESPDEAAQHIERLMEPKQYRYDNSSLSPFFDLLARTVRNEKTGGIS